MSDKFEIKIKSCKGNTTWYSNLIGNKFLVSNCKTLKDRGETFYYEDPNKYYITQLNDLILKEDCEILQLEKYEYVDQPDHYSLWDDMPNFYVHKKLLSREEFIGFLKGNILKYQMRLGKKPGEPIEREQAKIKLYKDELTKLLDEDKCEESGGGN